MKRFIVLILVAFMFSACAGVSQKIVHTEDGRAYKMEEVYSVGLFTPTYQWKRTSACEVEVTRINAPNSFGDGYDSKSVKNCSVIGSNDGFTHDTTSPVGPMLLQAGGTVGAGALIGDGIRDSSDTFNNTNQQGQLQGQAQGQFQIQKQGQIQGQKQGVKVQGGCRGNCGGGR